jgi:GNAT superfamily N-acetyltransferase
MVDAQRSATSADLILGERALPTPFVKDYDALPNNRPLDWPKRFDVTCWGFFAARLNGVRVGGAAIAFRCSGIDMLETRDDLALLWDIRVMPETRGKGVGSALLAAVERWAREQNAHWLKVETQNINVPACRFYARHGFALKAANALAYPAFPSEVQLLWYKAIGD